MQGASRSSTARSRRPRSTSRGSTTRRPRSPTRSRSIGRTCARRSSSGDIAVAEHRDEDAIACWKTVEQQNAPYVALIAERLMDAYTRARSRRGGPAAAALVARRDAVDRPARDAWSGDADDRGQRGRERRRAALALHREPTLLALAQLLETRGQLEVPRAGGPRRPRRRQGPAAAAHATHRPLRLHALRLQGAQLLLAMPRLHELGNVSAASHRRTRTARRSLNRDTKKAHENHDHRHRLRRPRHRRLSGRSRQRRRLPRRRSAQDRHPQQRRRADPRAGAAGDGRAQRARPAACTFTTDVDAGRRARRRAVHRGRHAARRGRLRRPAVRARGRAQHRPPHDRLQGDRRQVDGAGRHGRQGARRDRRRARRARRRAAVRGRVESRVPEGRRGGRRLHAARPHRDRLPTTRPASARATDARALRAVPAQPRPHALHGRALGRAHQVRGQRDARHAHLVHERARESGRARSAPTSSSCARASAPIRASAITSCMPAAATAARASRRTCRRCSRTARETGRRCGFSRRSRPSTRRRRTCSCEQDRRALRRRPAAAARFAVWGLAFKPNTDDMREAPCARADRRAAARAARA